MLSIVITGHVDHGKSTLIGRLLHDTDSLPIGKKEEIEAISRKRGMDMEWSFALDSYQAERNQAITIDTTQVFFKTPKRQYALIDAPGHKEFLKNMITGASQAQVGVLVVDVNAGMQEQTKRHAYLLSLLGIRTLLVVLNKMDQNSCDISSLQTSIHDYCQKIGLTPYAFIPMSAKFGQGIQSSYDGTHPSLLQVLDSLEEEEDLKNLPLLFRIQDIYRYDEKRVLVGRIDQGTLRVGDRLRFYPSCQETTVTSIFGHGKCVGITIEDPLFIERGHVGAFPQEDLEMVSSFDAQLFWMSKTPLKALKSYKGEAGCQSCSFYIEEINHVMNTDSLLPIEKDSVQSGEIAYIKIKSLQPLLFKKFVLFEGAMIAGGAIVLGEHQ